MYKILLVEDEPPAVRYLRNIIENKSQGFEVIGEAEDGQRALEMIELLQPDIVITDIRMPIMDGIELVSKIKIQFPTILSIISSGYSDFEYAKNALQAGVVEYLLKPVKPSQLQELLNTLKSKLDRHYYEKQVQLFEELLRGNESKAEELRRYLPLSTYNIALLRKNGPPSRYGVDTPNSFATIKYENKEELWILPGRDEYEVICIASNAIEDIVKSISATWIDKGYCTCVIYERRLEILDLKKGVKELIHAMQVSIIIGQNQILKGHRHIKDNIGYSQTLEDVLVKKVNFMVSNLMLEELKKEMIRIFEEWEEARYPLLEVENNIRQLLDIIKKYAGKPKEISCNAIEIALDEAVCYATSMGELMENIWDVMQTLLKTNKGPQSKLVKEDFLNSIEDYLVQKLAHPLSLQDVCNYLGISQTYLSRLFRKYKNTSFNEYITYLRINEAKKLMKENPQILLKDIAEMVGYSDPAYFSRVFRTITGISPSNYNNAE